MAKANSNRLETASSMFIVILSIVAIIIGAVFCYLGVTQILSISDIDVNILLRDPSEYMLSKRDVAMGGLEILIPGVTLLLMSVVVFTISITRSITLMHEGRAILRLDERIEKLEKNSKK